MVKVTVALEAPVLYFGSLVNVHDVEPESPTRVECASAPNDTTGVSELVAEVCDPLHAVPDAAEVQTYARTSPDVGGVVTDGPPALLKSDVTLSVIAPVPPVAVVLIL